MEDSCNDSKHLASYYFKAKPKKKRERERRKRIHTLVLDLCHEILSVTLPRMFQYELCEGNEAHHEHILSPSAAPCAVAVGT